MGLEPSDLPGLARLPNSVNGIANAYGCLDRLKLLIERDKHAWVHAQGQVEQEIVIFTTNKCVHVSRSVKSREESRQGRRGEQQLI